MPGVASLAARGLFVFVDLVYGRTRTLSKFKVRESWPVCLIRRGERSCHPPLLPARLRPVGLRAGRREPPAAGQRAWPLLILEASGMPTAWIPGRVASWRIATPGGISGHVCLAPAVVRCSSGDQVPLPARSSRARIPGRADWRDPPVARARPPGASGSGTQTLPDSSSPRASSLHRLRSSRCGCGSRTCRPETAALARSRRWSSRALAAGLSGLAAVRRTLPLPPAAPAHGSGCYPCHDQALAEEPGGSAGLGR